jgi:phage host-nuclease inhibitor protein Gam
MSKDIIISTALALAVVDKKTMEKASDLRSQVKKYLKDLTEEKEKVTKPLNDALKAERARFKPMEEKAEAVIKYLDKQMSDYQTAETKRLREEEEKIAARIGEGKGKLKLETAVAKLASLDTVDKTVGNTRFVTDYEVVVLDLKQIPDMYLKIEIKTALIKQVLKSGVIIPGVELKEVQRPREA